MGNMAFLLWLKNHPRTVLSLIALLVMVGLWFGLKHYRHKAADLQQVVSVQKAEIKQAGKAIAASSDHQNRIAGIASVTSAKRGMIERAFEGSKTQPASNSEAVQPEKCESQSKECPPCPEERKSDAKIVDLCNSVIDRFNDGMQP